MVGHVIEEPTFRALWEGEEVACIPICALTDAAPTYDRPGAPPRDLALRQSLELHTIPIPDDASNVLRRLLGSPNLASKEWVYRQYDHFVRGNTVVGPGADAAVVRIKGTQKGVAMTVDCNSRYCYLDPRRGGMIAVAEAARNLSCIGAIPLGLSDCLNFGSPECAEVMWQFSQAISGMREACLALEVPVVSGNVSFYNETNGEPIYPTPTIAMVGLLEKVERALTPWFKAEGDLVVLLGANGEELGGSEYLKVIHGRVAGPPPALDLTTERAVQFVCRDAIDRGLLRSAHDVAEGGLAVALAECCISGPGEGLGSEVEPEDALRSDALLFGETQSRIVASVAPENWERLQALARDRGVTTQVMGRVGGTALVIRGHIRVPVQELREIWSTALEQGLA